ncbi:MAG: polysaccharide deacetylase family protein [Chloroflexi bacterium]|nr:polysaccharide deacetylase family protein [Chloroflexota bacterium]
MYLNPVDTRKTRRSKLKEALFSFAFHSGLVRFGRGFNKNSLTVLNYHRIDDPDRADFDTFKPNVSARPADFDRQMDYMARWFNVVSTRQVVDWLRGGKPLPPHAALITFDDGYLDNYTKAYPILRKHNFPAIIFLTTNYIESDLPFFWDLVAYCFHHTKLNHIHLPNGTRREWNGRAEGEQVSGELIASLKILSEGEKRDWTARLPEMLEVAIPAGFFRNSMVSWDQVREMSQNGIEFGGHTMSHPILTRIPIEQAKIEILGSKMRVEKELGKETVGFAYPNGLETDYSAGIQLAVKEAGCGAAFTLLNGPSPFEEVKREPFTIRRIFISHRHTLPRFAALVSWVNRYRG